MYNSSFLLLGLNLANTSGCISIINDSDKRVHIISSQNVLQSLLRELERLKKGIHKTSNNVNSLYNDIRDNKVIIKFEFEEKAALLRRAKHVRLAYEYKTKGYTEYTERSTPLVHFKSIRYRPVIETTLLDNVNEFSHDGEKNTSFNHDLRRLSRHYNNAPLIIVELVQGNKRKGHVVGVFPLMSEAEVYVKETYKEGEPLVPKYATNEHTMLYFRLLKRYRDIKASSFDLLSVDELSSVDDNETPET